VKRRDFITLLGGAAVAWPLAARAQQGERMRRVGVLMNLAADDLEVQPRIASFLQGLQQLGWGVGGSLQIDYRWGAGNADSIRKFATELVALAPDVILADSIGTFAAKAATTTIPTVFITGEDPVRTGLVASLARPGGNLTGVNLLTGELTAKRLELLRELVPAATRVSVLVNPATTIGETTVRDVEPAARTMGLQIQVFNVSTSREIDAAFATFMRERPDAVLVGIDTFLNSRRVQLVNLAAYHRVPAAFSNRGFAEVGGLMSYGSSIVDAWRQAGVYTGRILKGEKPADLPVVQASKFELVINHQTARMLGLTVPDKLLVAADEVIE
jgi:putative tryptophan/tyrosine transport system substrate-binding protein